MPPLKPLSIPSFAHTQLVLLATELDSELAETSISISNTSPSALARAGLAITNLVLSSLRTGLGGKTVVELSLDPAVSGKGSDGGELPEHGIRVGDIVSVAEQPAGSAKKREVKELEAKGARGVVVRVQRGVVGVALDREEEDVPGGRLWVVKLANDVTYKR
jgi:DNA polymerase alpha-associated DNA helicase A